MARKRKPPNLAVDFLVQHPESEVERGWPRDADGEIDESLDTDGHLISFQVAVWRGEALAGVTLRRGMSPENAAAILRKLAARIEASPWLMTARQGSSGEFDAEGRAELDGLSLHDDYDDFGNLNTPDIE